MSEVVRWYLIVAVLALVILYSTWHFQPFKLEARISILEKRVEEVTEYAIICGRSINR